MTIIILFGAPGSGKGTQGALIAEKYGFFHLSTGLMLRDEVKKDTELGKIVDKFISKGDLVPDEMICDILNSEIDDYINEKGIIFDGFPRTIEQAEFLDKLLKSKGLKVNLMVDIEAEEDELKKRLINRGTLSHRNDDTHETIIKRLDIYKEQTKPVIDYYINTSRYNKVSSDKGIENTFAQLKILLDKVIL